MVDTGAIRTLKDPLVISMPIEHSGDGTKVALLTASTRGPYNVPLNGFVLVLFPSQNNALYLSLFRDPSTP